MYTIEQMEDAFMAALAPLKVDYDKQPGDPVIYATVKTIKSYQAELDSEEDIARAARLFPAVIVVYTGSTYAEHGSRKVEAMRYLLFCCDKNLRLEAEARRGGNVNPGAYALLNGVRDLLYGQQLGKEIYPVKLTREDPVYLGMGLSIYGAEYETAQALLYPPAA